MRIISRLDIKPPYLIKPIYFEGLRKIGDPKDYIDQYSSEGIDEILYIDVVSSLYRRPVQFNLIKKSSINVNVPLAVGGGIKTVKDANKIISIGADKVVINTHLFEDINFLLELANSLGSQACVAHIQAKKINNNFECLTDCGRNRTYKNVFDWARVLEDNGAGEIILSSVDNDGAMKGFNLELADKVINKVNIPVIVGSGCSSIDDIINLASLKPSGIAIGSALHFKKLSVNKIKTKLKEAGFMVRI